MSDSPSSLTNPESEAYALGYERGYINAPRSEADEYGGGWYSDDWRRGWDAGYAQWDGKRGFRGRMTTIDALEYVLERLSREANMRPKDQHPEALARKLAAIAALVGLRDSLSSVAP